MATFASQDYTELKGIFTGLTDKNFTITSPKTNAYNCLAWAVGKDNLRIDPFSGQWSSSVPRVPTIEALADVYREYGYESCNNGGLEEGKEKIAIYAEPMTGRITHAAKQLPDGSWTSKLGTMHDIKHDSPECIQGGGYGTVQAYMSRNVPKTRKRRQR